MAAIRAALARELQAVDPEVAALIERELGRQEAGLEMIPSENFASAAVMAACGSVLTNKYAEGQPGKRYYGGCQFVDDIERVAQERAKRLFGVEFANVQPHSGAQANQAVFETFLQPGDTFMGMKLDHGGHLTHGSPVNFSGKHYRVVGYGVRESDGLIDFDEVRALALQHRPKLMICGFTAYPRTIDFPRFAEIAREVGAVLLADISHVSGLVAAGVFPSPSAVCDIVSTTTHKTLRGPRSGMVMGRAVHEKEINKAVFPGLQGGPHMHTIAAKAVALAEAATPAFKAYATQVLRNAKTLAEELGKRGLKLVAGGTDSHMVLVDLRPAGVTGKDAEKALDAVHITCNKNPIPFDPQPPFIGSGLRMGTPALTTRGMKEAEMRIIAGFIAEVIAAPGSAEVRDRVGRQVHELSRQFPLFGGVVYV